ncbi:MAG TPA: exodeoxyribonuclease VII small subunit [Chloroflexota bacterium]
MSPNRKASSVPDEPTPAPRLSAGAFEAAFTELQHVVERLETGGLDLERAVELFDRGTVLAQTCERLVAEAELRVTRLTAETASPLSDA